VIVVREGGGLDGVYEVEGEGINCRCRVRRDQGYSLGRTSYRYFNETYVS